MTDLLLPPDIATADLRWAWRIVNKDFTSSNAYTWPFPGQWATPPASEQSMTTGDACPQFVGDGLCLATNTRGACSGGLVVTHSVGLLCAYVEDDVLGRAAEKLRVRRAWVAAVFDPVKFLIGPGAYLRGADLRAAYLRGANLGDADLRGADLRGADLRAAYLGDADLRGANLGDADLRGADLRGARGNQYTTLPAGWKVEESGLIVRVGAR